MKQLCNYFEKKEKSVLLVKQPYLLIVAKTIKIQQTMFQKIVFGVQRQADDNFLPL